MGVEVFGKLLGGNGFRVREFMNGPDDFIPAAVVKGDGGSEFFIVFGFLLPGEKGFLDVLRERFKVTDDVKLDAFF